ncbi:hypothetical protein [Paenibacillus radicis (ex Xue et al. 2023)]|uniref:Uncharacterized protein n=1 Tax=Paenibacillus radicis (ex Xue et al. 2023) TaxID=2972489 RepID=A0ABT1YJV4_9BACL|nr:hypothetical protein [Paenibacillus radicis (ex Xue et al. 2023)]MCR8633476.1 hypothetical protein [Paenibacillus radicis (ex Xue et al. 2023)]
MPKPSKIDVYQCQDIVWAGVRNGRSMRDIAKDCSEWAKESISHTAVAKFIKDRESAEQATKKEAIIADRRRVLKTVHQEIDIIQTNLDATKRLIERFEMVDDLPKMFKENMDEMMDRLLSEGTAELNYVAYIEGWQMKFEVELRRKVLEITTLNREVRENMKFLVALREKAFQFELVQEYIGLFMEIFQEESKDGAYERSIVRIASNPRMKQLADQQKLYTGGGE